MMANRAARWGGGRWFSSRLQGMSTELQHKMGLVLMRATVWGMAGAFFGVVYLVFLRHLEEGGTSLWNSILAAAVAGAIVATFYSAKRVAIFGAMSGSISAFLYVTLFPDTPSLTHVVGLAGVIGLVVGLVVSAFFERRRGALPLMAAGFGAGLVAGAVATLLAHVVPGFSGVFLLALFMAPATGALFTAAIVHIGPKWKYAVPHWLSVAIVSAVISAVIAIGMWLLAMTVAPGVDLEIRGGIQETLRKVPLAFGGGMLGAAVAGVALEVLNVRWIYR